MADSDLHATRVGEDGHTVVFLHGLFGQGRNFTAIAKGLTPQFSSYLIDLPNHGRSDWTHTVDYAHVAQVVADHLRAGIAASSPVHLVGHSMGGKVAMMVALHNPELIDRLVVVDISPAPSESSGEFEHLLDSLAALDLASFAKRSEADQALSEQVDDVRVRGFLLQNLRSGPDGFSWRANLELLRHELSVIGGFPEVDLTFDHPTLWIAGGRSDYVTDADGPRMRELFPRARLVRLNNAGHWVHSEQPEAFTATLQAFFEAADPR